MCGISEKRFLAVLAVARHEHDPATDWDAFADAAWREARAMFGAPEPLVVTRDAEQRLGGHAGGGLAREAG